MYSSFLTRVTHFCLCSLTSGSILITTSPPLIPEDRKTYVMVAWNYPVLSTIPAKVEIYDYAYHRRTVWQELEHSSAVIVPQKILVIPGRTRPRWQRGQRSQFSPVAFVRRSSATKTSYISCSRNVTRVDLPFRLVK